MQSPCHSIEQSNETCFCDTAFEKGVCGESAEGVVADFGVGWGTATVDESEVVVCWNGGDIEEDQPKVDSVRGL